MSDTSKPHEQTVAEYLKLLEPGGLEAKFLSRDRHLYARTLSQLLALQDSRVPRPAGEDMYLEDNTTHKHAELYNFNHETMLNMTLREFDVAAMFMSGKVAFDGYTIISDPKYTFSSNPESKEHLTLGRHHEAADSPLLALARTAFDVRNANDGPSLLAGVDKTQILDFVLARWQFWVEQGIPVVPYSEHVVCYMELLRDLHSATTWDDHRRAAMALRDFVMANSCGKMLKRLEFGVHGQKFGGGRPGTRWLFDILSRKLSGIPARAHSLALPTSLSNQYELQQRRILAEFFENKVRRPDLAQQARGAEIYDNQGRQRFQYMLATRLTGVKKALEDAYQAIRNFKKMPRPHGEDVELLRQEVKTTAKAQRVAVRYLSDIVYYFNDILYAHCQWLADVACVSEAKNTPHWGEELPLGSSSPIIPVGSSSPIIPVQWFQEPVAAGPQGEEEVEEEDKDLDNLRKFPRVAHKYLTLMCDHDLGLQKATAFDPEHKSAKQQAQSRSILDAPVSVMVLRTQDHDKERMSINECLETLAKQDLHKECQQSGQPQLAALDADKLKTMLQEQFDKDTQNRDRRRTFRTDTGGFGGNTHCEAIPMTLIDCLQDTELFKYVINQCKEWFIVPELFAVQVKLLETLSTWLALVHVTKRCCPLCWIMVEILGERLTAEQKDKIKEKIKLAAPGYHTVWTPVRLPSWTTKKMGEEVIARMEKQAFVILSKAQSQADQLRRLEQNSSQTSRHQREQTGGRALENESEDEEPVGEEDQSDIELLTSSPVKPSAAPGDFDSSPGQGPATEPRFGSPALRAVGSSPPVPGQAGQLPYRPLGTLDTQGFGSSPPVPGQAGQSPFQPLGTLDPAFSTRAQQDTFVALQLTRPKRGASSNNTIAQNSRGRRVRVREDGSFEEMDTDEDDD